MNIFNTALFWQYLKTTSDGFSGFIQQFKQDMADIIFLLWGFKRYVLVARVIHRSGGTLTGELGNGKHQAFNG